MPGLWVDLADNPDFYKSFEPDRGTYIESSLYDEAHHDQGKGLWRINAVEEKKKDGMWAVAKLLAVSDPHLHWWLTEGAGKPFSRKFRLHFCLTLESECRKVEAAR